MSPHENNFNYEISVIILCAGEGTRFKKITKKIPKSLIKIPSLNDIPILQYLIENLINLGIKQIAIITGHLGYKIEKFISNLKKANESYKEKLIVIDSGTQYRLGPLYSFLSITKNEIIFNPNNIFLVIPGDTIFDFELLKELYIKIMENIYNIQKYPIVFYKQVLVDILKEKYNLIFLNGKKSISIAEIERKKSNDYLKSFLQKDLRSLKNNDYINQIIPIFIFNYKTILGFLNLKNKISTNAIWELVNYIINQGEKVLTSKIIVPYDFYDIDSELDLNNFNKKKEMDNRNSNISQI